MNTRHAAAAAVVVSTTFCYTSLADEPAPLGPGDPGAQSQMMPPVLLGLLDEPRLHTGWLPGLEAQGHLNAPQIEISDVQAARQCGRLQEKAARADHRCCASPSPESWLAWAVAAAAIQILCAAAHGQPLADDLYVTELFRLAAAK